MSRSFVNTSDHLDSSGISISDTPFTMAIWYKYASTASSNAFITIGESGTGNNWFILRGITSAPKSLQIEEKDTVASGVNSKQGVGSGDTATWHLAVGVFTSHSSRTAFIDGGGATVGSGTRTASGMNVVKISGDTAASPGQAMNGKLAHAAIWNIALSDAQVYSLLYLYPNQVAVGNLVNYWPLTNNQSPEPDYGSGNLPLTVTGTTFSTDNPNIAGTLVQQLMGAIG